ncbi:MAG: RlmE family RNA methyltransferase [archaeon]
MYNTPDYYLTKAKQEGYLSRAVYKLIEIDNKFSVFHKNDLVLDLGAYPGSWSQYASERIGSKGRILSIDLKPIKLKLENMMFIQSNINNVDLDSMILSNGFNHFNVVLSDLAPNTTGNKTTDQFRSYELATAALNLTIKYLSKEGIFVCKLFDSQERDNFNSELRIHFRKIKIIRPKATRKNSKELYVVAINKQ